MLTQIKQLSYIMDKICSKIFFKQKNGFENNQLLKAFPFLFLSHVMYSTDKLELIAKYTTSKAKRSQQFQKRCVQEIRVGERVA